MSEYIKRYGRNSLIISILLCLLSLLLIFKPVTSFTFLTITLGGVLLAIGVIHVISYFRTDSDYRAFSIELLQGIVLIVIGLIFVINPSIIQSFIVTISGIWIVVESIIKLQLAINIKKEMGTQYPIVIVMAVFTLILGIIMILNPFNTMATLTVIAGISLLINEIINIAESIMILRIK